tara:strand:- start:23082 stop:23864 length:783 start_codon:yes stop_codon:yes gene_type:complete
MPKVTYTPFVDGAVPSGEQVYDNFYSLDPVNGIPDSSMAVMNGFLDGENFDIGGREIDYIYIQRYACSGADMIAGTASLDFFSDKNTSDTSPGSNGVFPKVAFPTTADKHVFKAIPGASIQFYLPYRAFVLLTWQVCWTNDSDDEDQETHIRLFVDGDKLGPEGEVDEFCNVRRVRRTMFLAATGSPATGTDKTTYNFLRDRYKGRFWCGHQWLPLPGEGALGKGFHSASLRLIQHSGVKQSRVRARSMKVIYFKATDDE